MTKPDTSGIHVWLVLMKAHKALSAISSADIARSGLCLSDFEILELLLNKGPMPVNTVGDRVFLTSGSSTAAVDRLEKRGLVRRESDASDRRSRIVHLTSAGRNLISGVFAEHAKVMEQTAHALTSTERATLVSLLKKLGKTANQTTTVFD
ncbi:MAG TPA: MarR family transcriptional regulator [Terriglobales bacterium]|jgi:MarR family 2-MHQ and catechol resistance regulon transcriptional repressor|nr:MarR family transcriptional regulator [Terriglobales bacterium]